MFTLRATTIIHAPIARCFLLSTSLAIVERELGMHPSTGGRTSGLVTAGDTIRWQGWQLGLRHVHVSLIDLWDPPYFFRDRMIAGRFRSFEHDHTFAETFEGTRLDDELRFTLPWGPLGWLAGALILAPHINRLMRRRFRLLKHIAETEEWQTYIEPGV